jgi:hypothetical protein
VLVLIHAQRPARRGMSVEQYIRKVRKQNDAEARKAERRRREEARMAEAAERVRAKRAERERLRREREQRAAAEATRKAERAAAAEAREADRAAAAEVKAARKAARQAAKQEKLEAATRRRVARSGKAMVLPMAKPGVLKFFLPKPTIRLPARSQATAAAGELPKDVKVVRLRLKGAGVAKIRCVKDVKVVRLRLKGAGVAKIRCEKAQAINVRLGGARTLNLYGAC